jgi:hypothetical protein
MQGVAKGKTKNLNDMLTDEQDFQKASLLS